MPRKSLALAVEVTFALAWSSAAVAAPPTFYVANLNDSGSGSLRQAITNANGAGTAAVVDFQSELTGTITLTTGEIAISNSVTINGPGSDVITVSGGGTSRIFDVHNGSNSYTVNISGLTLRNGYSATQGGAVYCSGNYLTLSNSVIENNVANGSGGGVVVTSNYSSATLLNDTFSNNSAPSGCGFLLVTPTASISGVVAQKNTCTTLGGGGEVSGGTVTVSGSQFSNNTGGGLYARAPNTITISNSQFTGNYIATYGGGFSSKNAKGISITGSTFSDNTAAKGGGGVSIITPVGDVVISHSTIDSNQGVGAPTSKVSGGGLLFKGHTTSAIYNFGIEYSTISNNTAFSDGGVDIIAGDYTAVSLIDSTIAGNVATNARGGGAISMNPPNTLTVESSTIAANTAQTDGGIFVSNYVATFHDSIVAGNISTSPVTGGPGLDVNGSFTANFSLFGVVEDGAITGDNNLTGVDPKLGPLANYGGGIATMLPLTGSPAIDAGDPGYDTSTLPAVDERGLTRVVGTAIDIGAVEVQASEDTIFVNGFDPD